MARDKNVHAMTLESANDPSMPGDEEALTPEEYAAWEAAAVEEGNRRMADFRAGRTTAVPWEEVKARLLARFG